MTNLTQIYNDFCLALATAKMKELHELDRHLAGIQREDWQAGGLLARDVQHHVQFLIDLRGKER